MEEHSFVDNLLVSSTFPCVGHNQKTKMSDRSVLLFRQSRKTLYNVVVLTGHINNIVLHSRRILLWVIRLYDSSSNFQTLLTAAPQMHHLCIH